MAAGPTGRRRPAVDGEHLLHRRQQDLVGDREKAAGPERVAAWFIEGLGDNVQSLDADALGVLYLISKNETTNAQKVLAYTNNAFAVSGRSVTKSTSADTFNDAHPTLFAAQS